MGELEDKINQRIKCRAYKNLENPDGRESLCGEPVQTDENGREFFEVPGHQRDYLVKLLPSYEFSENYDSTESEPAKVKAAKKKLPNDFEQK